MDQPQDNTPHDGENGNDEALAQAEAIIDDAIVRDSVDEVTPEDSDKESDNGVSDDPTDADEQGADNAHAQAEAKATEHLDDLRRLQAEFVNYRKRVDRDRANAGEFATTKLIESLIPVLDDLAAAREHGDLTEGPFVAIADKLEETLGRHGWSRYGAIGDVFDPALHEALMSQPSADVTEPTVAQVAQPGHSIGDKVIRPARVVVSQPE